ncbi:hypothetical protein GCM10017788_56500 [Amycolatopsis acidiphila]|nr:hypothetical protein GCM10017788_56500 [Amycolatopsis acidiphila]
MNQIHLPTEESFGKDHGERPTHAVTEFSGSAFSPILVIVSVRPAAPELVVPPVASDSQLPMPRPHPCTGARWVVRSPM